MALDATPSYSSLARSMIGMIFLAVCAALSLAPEISQAAPAKDDAQVLLKEARARISEGRVAEAIILYRRIARLLPYEPNVRKELARLLASIKETRNEAEKVYAETSAIIPQDANLALERAANLAVLGDHVNASLEYRRAFQLTPDNEQALAGYIQQITRLGSAPVALKQLSEKLATTPGDIASRLMLAGLLHRDGRYNNALDQFSILQSIDPHNVLALRGMAEAWLALGYYDWSTEVFQRADRQAERGRFLANQARVMLASGQPEAALKLLATDPTNVDKEPLALVVLADSYRAMKQPLQERATLERLLNLFPAPPHSALERLARIRFEMGEKAAAIKLCQQLLVDDPQNPIASLGLLLNGHQSAQQAIENSSLTPTRRAAKEQAEAEAAIFWNQPERAIAALRRVLLMRENCPRLLLQLAATLLQKGDTEDALTAFARIAISNGKWPDALSGMAEAESLRGNPQRALAINAEVLKIDPTNFRALSGQAENLYQIGEIERATLLFNNLHKRFPESIRVRERLRAALNSFGHCYQTEQSIARSLPAKDNLAEGIQPISQPVFIKPVLKAGDVVKITVARQPRLSAEIRVDDSGMVKLPFLTQSLHAACLTEQELSTRIANYGEAKLAASEVSATITEFHRKSLKVSGAVYLPGLFNIRKPLGLNEALMLASGANQRAGRIVYVVREDDSCRVKPQGQTLAAVEAYERSEIEKGSVIMVQPLQAGDAVIVPDKDSAFVVGEVARPGTIKISSTILLLEALEQRGGILEGGRSNHIILTRLNAQGTARQRFLINLDEIKQHRVGDVILQPGDIVNVTSINQGKTDNSFMKLLQQGTP